MNKMVNPVYCQPIRCFNTNTSHHFNNGMPLSSDDALNLSEATTAYEYDNTNSKRAYEYFVELNKHHYYLSVIREYETFKELVPYSKN
jgi:hypothetical protein